MAIKSDKTFEEIVERLVALFQPQPEKSNSDAYPKPASAIRQDPPAATITRAPSRNDTQ